MVATLLW